MASSVDLVVRVLADTSQAGKAFEGFSSNIGKALGIGAAGGSAALLVTATTKAAVDMQSAMARVQVAFNSADFAPGTDKFAAAKAKILQDSTELATSADDVASVYAQAGRYVDEFGNKLPTDKLNEMTDVVLRLAKVSTDNMAPEQIGQQIDVLSKLNNTTDFTRLGNEVSQLAQSHNQGEGQTFQTAIPLAQYGAQLGVTPEQQLGVATYLVDRQAGGNQAGASIGRMFMRMDQSAEDVLDPTVTATKARQVREAGDHLSDLQASLAEETARQQSMYGQHGLKTAYQKNPAEVLAAQDRVDKLNREIGEAQDDMSATAAGKPARGQMDVAAMAKVAGMSAVDYANEIKSDPMTALLDFTKSVGALPANQRDAALRGAGITNVRDIKTANVLASEPDVLARYIAEAQGAGDQGTALNNLSDVVLGTTASKTQDVANLSRNTAAAAGESGRQGLDALDDAILKLGKDAGDSTTPVGQVAQGLMGMAGVLGTIAPIVGPFIATRMAMGAAGAAAAGPAAGAAGAGGFGAMLAGGAGALAGGGLAFLQIQDMQRSLDALNTARAGQGLAPVQVNIGDIVSQGGSPDEMLQHVIAAVTAAWNTAMSTTPVAGTVGGNIGGSTPAR